MATLNYGAVGIGFVQTILYDKRAIYDGPQYLYTRHTVHIRGIYNPAVTSYTWPPQFGQDTKNQAPSFGLGHNPAVTEVSIRDYLMQPRRQLIYTVGSYDATNNPVRVRDGAANEDLTILRSPLPINPALPTQNLPLNAPGLASDATDGPKPLFARVKQIAGTKTFIVEYGIQTDLNEAYLYYSANVPLILSNTWEVEDDLDEDFYTSRTIRGRAVFDQSSLQRLDSFADDYRHLLFFPVPDNCKRTNVRTRLSKDGTILDYSYTDEEQALNIIVDLNVTRIEGVISISQSREGLIQAAVDSSPIIFATAQAGGAAGARFGSWFGPWGRAIGFGLGTAAGGAAGAFVGTAPKLVPQSALSLLVRVWGSRDATVQQLTQAAGLVMLAKIPAARRSLLTGLEMHFDHDFMGTFVQLHVIWRQGPVDGIANLLRFEGDAFQALNAFGVLSNDVLGVATGGGEGPLPPFSNGTRGTVQEAMVPQSLLDPHEKIGQPGYTDAIDRTPP
jgi:hypothetical protein